MDLRKYISKENDILYMNNYFSIYSNKYLQIIKIKTWDIMNLQSIEKIMHSIHSFLSYLFPIILPLIK